MFEDKISFVILHMWSRSDLTIDAIHHMALHAFCFNIIMYMHLSNDDFGFIHFPFYKFTTLQILL